MVGAKDAGATVFGEAVKGASVIGIILGTLEVGKFVGE